MLCWASRVTCGVEPLFGRFFALMSLFGGAMLLLTVADNLLLLFVGWEIMGLCSYMLIGFWYARAYDEPRLITPSRAAVKAFMTTRVADVFMLLGIVFFYRVFGTLNFHEAFTAESLVRAAEAVGFGGLAVMTLLLFTGTVGKSAQWPLHTWLPDAMEGPTPVSAVIHAAAMVSAGVYMLIRIFPLVATAMAEQPYVGLMIGGIGALPPLWRPRLPWRSTTSSACWLTRRFRSWATWWRRWGSAPMWPQLST
jgi:NADH-quinone oxidoreductase subunit L